MTQTSPPPSPLRLSRRTRFTVLVPLVVLVGWYLVSGAVRGHVDGVIQATVGRPLPAFRLTDQAGEEWTPERLRGRPALLHFVRSHCEACAAEAADYRALEAATAGRATVLHVLTDRVLGFPAADTQATLQHHGFAAPVLFADAAFVDAFHQVAWSKVTPVTYLVDGGGVIRTALRGKQTQAGLQAALAALP